MASDEHPDRESGIVEDDGSRHLDGLTGEAGATPLREADCDRTLEESLCYCSFCGKSQKEVRKLIAGPRVFICDKCIELCQYIIAESIPRTQTSSVIKVDCDPKDEAAP